MTDQVSARRRREVIDALRRGTVPANGLDLLAVGLERFTPALDADLLDEFRQRYDEAAAFGVIHNRLRDWHEGNHPGYALSCWLREYKEQVFLFTRDFAVDWTTNVAERGAKAAKRHQAVSGYWHTLGTLARWCRIRSYLDSAAAHRLTALHAIRDALAGKPWLPPLPAVR